jgi:hypothetical protein
MPLTDTGLLTPFAPSGAEAFDTPQRTPRHLRRFGRRDAFDVAPDETVEAASVAHARAVKLPYQFRQAPLPQMTRHASPAPTPERLGDKLAEHLGWNYCFSNRCTGSTHCHDCSGYQCWAMNALGVYVGCTTSFVLAQMCHDLGLAVTYDDLYDGLIGWAFRGANEGRTDDGSQSNGASGHIVYVDMKRWRGTLEAMGRAYGVRVGIYNRTRQFTGFYRILGLDYHRRKAEATMIVQTHHYDEDGKPAGETHAPPGYEANRAIICISADGTHLEARWGASIANDRQVHPTLTYLLRVWVPTRPLPPGERFMSLARADNSRDGVALVSDGTTRSFRMT